MARFQLSLELWERLLRQIGRRARNQSDAEDLLQSAYIRLMKYQKENAVENVEAFLVRAAFNIDVDNYRKEKLFFGVTSKDGIFSNECPLQDEVLQSQVRLRRVKEGLDQLTPRTRDIFLMHRLEGLKYHEVARRLGISRSAVEKHVAKAARFLTIWSEGW